MLLTVSINDVSVLGASLQRYLNASSFFLFLYDYCLTLSLEVDLFWTNEWNATKVLFLLTRYLPFLDFGVYALYHYFISAVNVETCSMSWKISTWMYVLGIGIAEGILIIRTWAVWGKDKRVIAILFSLFLAAGSVICYVMVRFLGSMEFEPTAERGCNFLRGNTIESFAWVALIAFETVMLVLMLVRGYTTYAHSLDFNLFHILYVDGSLYYACLFVLSVANITFIFTFTDKYALAFATIQRIMHSILTGRMLLNLRYYGKYAARGDYLSFGSTRRSTGDMMFRHTMTMPEH